MGFFEKIVPRTLVGLLLGWVLMGPTSAAGTSPAATVATLNQALVAAMQSGALGGFEGRKAILGPAIREAFDMPFVARLTLGRHGRNLTEQQHADFAARFSRIVIATYVSRFKLYDGERFVVVSERPLKQGRRLVQTEVIDRDGDKVALDYMLQQKDGAWYIVNVVAEGISELSLRRAEYTAVINREGFTALLVKLDEQVVKLTGKTSASGTS
ncbi:MAG: toluene tolerance protein [Chromatiales bacterium]|jgi:phospholipid transport system substrate-binding protein|nr:toluene tolerance protein [Chromatiales bacterium]